MSVSYAIINFTALFPILFHINSYHIYILPIFTTTMPFTSRFIFLFIGSKSKNILSAWANTHMRKHVNAVEPELERYAGLVQQLKGKNREWKNLLA
jgi:hypothetical protein